MSIVYNRGSTLIGGDTGRINYLADAGIVWILLGAGYTPDRAHNFISDLVPGSNELTGPGYVAGFGNSGRKALTAKQIVENDVSNRTEYQAANPTWTAIDAGTLVHAIVAKQVTSDADSPLIACLTGTAKATNGGDLTVTLPGGIAFQLNT